MGRTHFRTLHAERIIEWRDFMITLANVLSSFQAMLKVSFFCLFVLSDRWRRGGENAPPKHWLKVGSDTTAQYCLLLLVDVVVAQPCSSPGARHPSGRGLARAKN